ncbi:MAG: fucose isomerase [Oscillospiraceae bacterium]|jgi:L-fucose mutarotase|nr:fucose isomerase [Oscillospiraceae bacterium]
MLKNIPPILSPELLKTLAEMGHGDELVLGDANFPSAALGTRVVRADGHGIPALLDAILQYLPLDGFVDCPVALMDTSDPNVRPPIWQEYSKSILRREGDRRVELVERFAFYERARAAYAVVATGETELYANIILKKGVVAEH